jgi:hypothetical protein
MLVLRGRKKDKLSLERRPFKPFIPRKMSQNAKKHAIPLLQMQASFTTQKQEFIYLLCLIMMYTESKYKTFNAPLLSIRRKSPMQMQKTQSKRFQTKHALKAMRTERK